MSYLIYMSIRIIEMHRILRNTGSLYLHCDPTMSHYLKLVLDAIFGKIGFKSEIVWRRTDNHNAAKRYGPIHDVILFYTKSSTYTWNRVVVREYTTDEIRAKFPHTDSKKRRWAKADLTGAGLRDGVSGTTWHGCNPADIGKGRHWAAPNIRSLPSWIEPPSNWSKLSVVEKLDSLFELDLIHLTNKIPYYKKYHQEGTGPIVQDFMFDICQISNKEYLGYPTQKPLALLERLITASSNPDDIVLDPFCGCATACSAAEKTNRRWIGIDISSKAYDLVRQRLKSEAGLDKFSKGAGEIIHRVDIPSRKGERTTCYKDVLYGRQEGNCAGCCHHFEYRNLEIDHIIPRAKGGPDIDDNIQLLCGSCNRIKGSKLDMAGLKARLKELGWGVC